MPRVAIKKKEYMLSDFGEWVVGRMKKFKVNQTQMGKLIGLSQPAFCQKLKKNQFSLEDAMTFFKVFKATDEEILRLMKM